MGNESQRVVQESNDARQYVNVESLLPFGGLLEGIRGTNKAVHVAYYCESETKTSHHWIAHLPNYGPGTSEFLSVKISTNVGSVNYVELEDASRHLKEPRFYEWREVVRDVVDVERTPIPYKKEDRVMVECPECDRFGTTHPWKLDDYVPDECPCGYGGDWNVR